MMGPPRPTESPLQLVVCFKHVPDPTEPVRYMDEPPALSREDVQGGIGPLDDRALEAALRLAAVHADLEVVALCMGPASARDSLRCVLAKGADRAVHLSDPAFAGSDLRVTAQVLAAALARLDDVVLVMLGETSSDARSGALGPALASLLGAPWLAGVTEVALEPTERSLEVTRQDDRGRERRRAPFPSVLGFADGPLEPRLPSFSGIMHAPHQPLEVWTAAELGLGSDTLGLAGSKTLVVSLETEAPREGPEAIAGSEPESYPRLAAQLRQLLARPDAPEGDAS